MNEKTLKALAKVYTNHKKELIRLMNESYDSELPKDASHLDVIKEYKYLLNNSLDFREDIDALMVAKKIISPDYNWSNAVDPVTAGLEAAGKLFGTIGTIVGSVGARKRLELEQDIQSDKFFQDYLLNEQSKSSGGKILLITGITFVVIGLTMFLIFRNRKKQG